MRALWRRVAAWRWTSLVVAGLIVAAALGLRLHELTTLPAGFHGDEAVAGQEAQRILREGSIGPYSPYVWGQPTGPIYLMAASVWAFGNTIFAVRLVPALLGALTVLALYLLLRRAFGLPVAIAGASLLAVMSWHLHYARIGFPLEAWPLAVTLAVAALMEARRRDDWRWWLAAGGLAGLGMHAYNAHPLFLGILVLFIGLDVLWRRRLNLAALGGFVAMLALAALPLAVYALTQPQEYATHFQEASFFQREEWLAAVTLADKARLIAGRYVGFWEHACCKPEVDLVDASGITPLARPALLLLAAAGALLGLARRRHPLVVLGLLIVLLTPFGAVFTVGAVARRTLIMAPFLATFAALGAVEIVALARAWGRRRAAVAAVAAAGLFGLVAAQTWHDYFVTFAGSPEQRRILGDELTDASLFMADLPDEHYVYFYFERASFHYPTRPFLAPDARGEDRSAEFGRPGFDIDPAQGAPVFVLVGAYKPAIEEVQRLYPDGQTYAGGPAQEPTFIAYIPPPDARFSRAAGR